MGDPFVLEGPANISFSGGRTSAYMLRRILDAGLPPDVHVLFANTGKEREETLDFVRECGARWDIQIHWLEYDDADGAREVSYETASRNGEPFEALIKRRGFVPHPGSPYCSTELKTRVLRDWMQARGHDEWSSAVGLRADEPTRVARMRGRKVEGGWVEFPLADAGVTLADVDAFWRDQPFDLRLRPYEGNCDLCFKKAARKVRFVLDADPSRGAWWAGQERATGSRFRNDRPGYEAMADMARRQVALPILVEDEDSLPCGCAA